MDAKDKRIAELEATVKQQDELLKEQQRNVASPCGFLDVWNDNSASFRREYTTEWLLEHAKMAKENDGIIGMRYQLQQADNKTDSALQSWQVYLSHCVSYDVDNKEKADLGVTYRNTIFSKNVAGRNFWAQKPKKELAVASVN
jgi:hypothetical protein